MAIPQIIADDWDVRAYTTKTTAQPLIAKREDVERITSVLLYADPDNVGNVLVGTEAFQAIKLPPGKAISLPMTKRGAIFYRGTQDNDTLVVVVTMFSSLPNPLVVRPGKMPKSDMPKRDFEDPNF
jgi:hypothetical protein